MDYRQLGKTDLNVSVVAMGCWAIGGDPEFWGTVDDNESIAAIQKALDLGINFIDTAPAYGHGHSEAVVGKATAGRRENVVLATKCGVVSTTPTGDRVRCLKPDSVIAECEESLRRLRVEEIDLYQLHWPDPDTPIEETMAAMLKLKEQGKIRYIGVSNFSCQQMTDARRVGPIDCLQPELSMLTPDATDDLIPYCQEYDIGVIAYGPMARGLLTGKFTHESSFNDLRDSDPRFKGERFDRNLQLVERLKSVAVRLGCTVAQLALRWVIDQPGVTAAIAGAKRSSQVQDNVGAGDLHLDESDRNEIQAILQEHQSS